MSVQTVHWGAFVWGPTLTTQPKAQPAKTSLLSWLDFPEDWSSMLAMPQAPRASSISSPWVSPLEARSRAAGSEDSCVAAPPTLSFPHKKPWSAGKVSYTGKGFSEPRGLMRWNAPTLQVTCPPLGCGIWWSTS